MKKRIMAMLICMTMLFALLPCFTITASAASNVPYVDAKGIAQTPIANATDITSSTTTWKNGWYYASGNVTISKRVTVSGTVNLILADGANLTINGGISVLSGNAIIIWGQSGGTGKLTANGGTRQTGIGSHNDAAAGNITINGGNITANGGAGKDLSAPTAIGGARNGKAGAITINGGNVTANGKENNGIGNAATTWGGGPITITGGVITTNGLGATNSVQSAGMVNVKISGCPIIYCTGPRNTTWGATWTSGILFTSTGNGATGTVFGNPILDRNTSIPSNKKLNIGDGQTLTVAEGITFTNNGTINVAEGGKLIIKGNFINNGNITGKVSYSVTKSGTNLTIDGADLAIATSDYTTTFTMESDCMLFPENITVKVGGTELTEGYTYENGILTISKATITSGIEIIAKGVEIGDLDGNDECTNADIVMLARYLVDLAEFTEEQLILADMDGSGEVRNNDLVILVRKVVEA